MEERGREGGGVCAEIDGREEREGEVEVRRREKR